MFLDGNSNLVLRATRDDDSYFGGLVSGNWRGAIGTAWEARIKLNCLTGGCWPVWWEDYVDGAEPYFSVPAIGIEHLELPIRERPFNDPGYNVFPVLNLAVGGSGGGDPASGTYPAEMLIDWVRVF